MLLLLGRPKALPNSRTVGTIHPSATSQKVWSWGTLEHGSRVSDGCHLPLNRTSRGKLVWHAISRESPISDQIGSSPLPETSWGSSLKVTDLARPLYVGTFCKASCKADPSGFHKSQLKVCFPPLTLLFAASRRAEYAVILTSSFSEFELQRKPNWLIRQTSLT